MSVGVVIADDHALMRRGLRELIAGDPRFDVVAEAATGLEALEALRRHRPAIAVCDVSMPELDGLQVLAQTRTWADPPAIILLTMHDDLVRRALDDGAMGYILKECAEAEVLTCLSEVLAGRRFVSPRIGWRLSASGEVELEDPLASLTPTEVRVLRLLAQFKTSREIASIMSVSPRTVQNHRANMCAKLGLKGAKALLQFALDHAGTATG